MPDSVPATRTPPIAALLLLLPLLLHGAWACGAVQRPDGGEGLLPVGSSVPSLRAVDHNGRSVELGGGGYTLVYFYPMDSTPGCTAEACAFRDVWDSYEQAGVRVIGVSTDDDESHRAFAAEYELPFSLIADTDRRWAVAFGVGSTLGLSSRVSFLIDGEGRIARTYPDVDAGLHAERVLADHRALVGHQKP